MDFDTATASLRDAAKSGEAFLQKLGFLMEESLPDHTTVTKTRRGFFRPVYEITKVEIKFEKRTFVAFLEGRSLKTEIAQVSSGITIGRTNPDLESWIDALRSETMQAASGASQKSATGMIRKLG